MRLDHVGIAVTSLKEALPVFEKLLGCRAESEEVVEDQKVRVAAFKVGESRLELLEATSADSPVARFVAKRGPGCHHLTLAVADLEETLVKLEQSGVRLIDRQPRLGAGNKRIAFLHPSSTCGVLIELVEEKPSGPNETSGGRTGRKSTK
ncbi:MAG: methylmalonyl-CoA epimerase [Acidobacteria bacterium]|nr:MAG: methylmalonyl-CoA epimerase [Acidobacteriota bacterium]